MKSFFSSFAKLLSFSIAKNELGFLNLFVKLPVPGPTSKISLLEISITLIILLIIFSSTRKF